MTDRVLVLGGTGHYGQQVVRALLSDGVQPRVLTRSAERARALFPAGVEVVEGDLTRPDGARPALEGLRAVISAVSAFTPQLIERRMEIEVDGVLGVLRLAREAGVERFVHLSGYELREEFIRALGLETFARPMLALEQGVRESGAAWTTLGICPSMELFFRLQQGARLVAPGGGPPAFPTVAAPDVGLVAARTALRGDLAGQRLQVCGPQALDFAQAARILGEAQGRRIRVIRPPLVGFNLASTLARPFHSYPRYVYWSVLLLNHFPDDLARAVPAQAQWLARTFRYRPLELREVAQARARGLAWPEREPEPAEGTADP